MERDRGVSIEASGHKSVELQGLPGGLAISLRFFLALRPATQVCRPPQGTGPLPATAEARSSVTLL